MARNSYGFEKRQRELSRARKKEEKRQRKLDRKNVEDETRGGAPDEPGASPEATSSDEGPGAIR